MPDRPSAHTCSRGRCGALGTALTLAVASAAGAADYVIQISVDGLRSVDLEALIEAGEVRNFERFHLEGAGTLNARTDQTKSLPFEFFGFEKLVQTLPNHTSMLTGRPIERDNVIGEEVGHGYTSNDDPLPGETVHNFLFANSYKASTFDVVHDHGLRTGLFAAKGKFILFEQSWSEAGAPDEIGEDDGPDKIDVYVNMSNAAALTAALVAELQTEPMQYVFLHYRDPDSVGHDHGWGTLEYLDAVRTVDAALGPLFDLVEGEPFAGHTALILTADHGGGGLVPDGHVRYDIMLDTRVPFYVWGSGVTAGADLYALNPGVRVDPGSTVEVGLSSPDQPFRNGDGANLALDLLSLGPIPCSLYNYEQTIVTQVPCPADIDGTGIVDVADLVAVIGAWGGGGGPADVNGDGAVSLLDLIAVILAWGSCT